MDRNELWAAYWELYLERDRIQKQSLAILRSDPDYAAYIDRVGGGSRLPIRTFWVLFDRMAEIERAEPRDAEDAARYWDKCKREYRKICAELAL